MMLRPRSKPGFAVPSMCFGAVAAVLLLGGCGGRVDTHTRGYLDDFDGGSSTVDASTVDGAGGAPPSVRVDWWVAPEPPPFEGDRNAHGNVIFPTRPTDGAPEFSPGAVEHAIEAIGGLSLETEPPWAPAVGEETCAIDVRWDNAADGLVDGTEARHYDAGGRLVAADFVSGTEVLQRVVVERDAQGNALTVVSHVGCGERGLVEEGELGFWADCETPRMSGIVIAIARAGDGAWIADVVVVGSRGTSCERMEMSADRTRFERYMSWDCSLEPAHDVVVSDVAGHLVRYERSVGDQDGETASATPIAGGTTTVRWSSTLRNAAGNAHAVETPVAQSLVRREDPSGRLVGLDYDQGDDGTVDQTLTVERDGAGRVLSESTDLDVDGITDLRRSWQYDEAGRTFFSEVRNMTAPGDFWGYESFEIQVPRSATETTMEYDDLGRLESRTVLYDGGVWRTGDPVDLGVGIPSLVETRQYADDGLSVHRHQAGTPALGGFESATQEDIRCAWTSSCQVALDGDAPNQCGYGAIADYLFPPYDELPWQRTQGVPRPQWEYVRTDLVGVVGYPWF